MKAADGPLNALIRHLVEKKTPLEIVVTRSGFANGSILNGRDETVTEAGACFDKKTLTRGIAERLAEGIDGGIETVFEIDMQAGPEFFGEFVARDESARLAQKELKDAKRLVLKRNADAGLTQFAQFQIKLERGEMNYFGGHTFSGSQPPGLGGAGRGLRNS